MVFPPSPRLWRAEGFLVFWLRRVGSPGALGAGLGVASPGVLWVEVVLAASRGWCYGIPAFAKAMADRGFSGVFRASAVGLALWRKGVAEHVM